jgi:4,5-DOPA dioxygenase extradiol
MFALQPGKAGALLNDFSQHFSETRAVLIISPHWMTKGLAVTSGNHLETIHDFSGFPDPLYKVSYNAPGEQSVAAEVQQQLETAGYQINMDANRGRDHGAWVPMIHLLPEENLPVIQLSLDRTLNVEGLLKLGQSLKPLRDQGIAIIASGSLTHNLYEIQPEQAPPFAYADRFEKWVRACVQNRDTQQLIKPHQYNQDFKRSHPTDEHYVTLLIALGASEASEQLHVLEGGILHGVISMESYGWV